MFYTFKTIDKSKIDLNGLYTTKICILEVNLKNTETNYKEFSISHIIKKVKINLWLLDLNQVLNDDSIDFHIFIFIKNT